MINTKKTDYLIMNCLFDRNNKTKKKKKKKYVFILLFLDMRFGCALHSSF